MVLATPETADVNDVEVQPDGSFAPYAPSGALPARKRKHADAVAVDGAGTSAAKEPGDDEDHPICLDDD